MPRCGSYSRASCSSLDRLALVGTGDPTLQSAFLLFSHDKREFTGRPNLPDPFCPHSKQRVGFRCTSAVTGRRIRQQPKLVSGHDFSCAAQGPDTNPKGSNSFHAVTVRGLNWRALPKRMRRIHGGGDFHFVNLQLLSKTTIPGAARRRHARSEPERRDEQGSPSNPTVCSEALRKQWGTLGSRPGRKKETPESPRHPSHGID